MASILRVWGSTPSSEILCPREVTSFSKIRICLVVTLDYVFSVSGNIPQFSVVIDQGI